MIYTLPKRPRGQCVEYPQRDMGAFLMGIRISARDVIAIQFYRLSDIHYFGVDMSIYQLLGISQIQGRFNIKEASLVAQKIQ